MTALFISPVLSTPVILEFRAVTSVTSWNLEPAGVEAEGCCVLFPWVPKEGIGTGSAVPGQ